MHVHFLLQSGETKLAATDESRNKKLQLQNQYKYIKVIHGNDKGQEVC